MTGLALLVMADLLLAWLPGLPGLVLGVTLWGLHMGFTQGVFSALIADSAPEALRGTAFGVFYLVTGVALLVASVLAGGLWDWAGYRATFMVGGGFALVTLAGLWFTRR